MGLIFDMDGTLLDNNPLHFKAWVALCQEYGKKLTLQEYKEAISGINSEQTIKYLFGNHLDASSIQNLKNKKDSYYKAWISEGIQPLDGLMSLVEAAFKNHIPMAIASSASPQNIRYMLDLLQLTSYFTAIADSTMVPHGKPAPDIFKLAAQMLDMSPDTCIAFEDSIHGIRAAKTAGMFTIALSTSHQPQELSRLADMVVPNYLDLNLPILQELLLSHDIH